MVIVLRVVFIQLMRPKVYVLEMFLRLFERGIVRSYDFLFCTIFLFASSVVRSPEHERMHGGVKFYRQSFPAGVISDSEGANLFLSFSQ